MNQPAASRKRKSGSTIATSIANARQSTTMRGNSPRNHARHGGGGSGLIALHDAGSRRRMATSSPHAPERTTSATTGAPMNSNAIFSGPVTPQIQYPCYPRVKPIPAPAATTENL